jgi:sec-independent protein translocase protein TatC
MLRTYRKYAFVIILVIAAVITPPDIVSMTICAIPILMLYEVSIWISVRAVKDEDKKDEVKEWS